MPHEEVVIQAVDMQPESCRTKQKRPLVLPAFWGHWKGPAPVRPKDRTLPSHSGHLLDKCLLCALPGVWAVKTGLVSTSGASAWGTVTVQSLLVFLLHCRPWRAGEMLNPDHSLWNFTEKSHEKVQANIPQSLLWFGRSRAVM